MPTPVCILGAITFAVILSHSRAQSAEAPVVVNNPTGVQYVAQFPANNTGPSGAVVISSAPDGAGVNVQIAISNLPTVGGPFLTGNCTSTGDHLDPYNVTEVMICNPRQPKDCTVAFAGNRSIVLHCANKTRIACADLTNGKFPTEVSATPIASTLVSTPVSSTSSAPNPGSIIQSTSIIVPEPANQAVATSNTITITVVPSPLSTTVTSLQTPADVTQVVSPPATTITMVSTPSTDLGTTTIFGQPSTVTITTVQTAPPSTLIVSAMPGTVTVVELQSQA
nr:cell surface superoxide dismutase [cu-zn] 6 [Quercus suber]